MMGLANFRAGGQRMDNIPEKTMVFEIINC